MPQGVLKNQNRQNEYFTNFNGQGGGPFPHEWIMNLSNPYCLLCMAAMFLKVTVEASVTQRGGRWGLCLIQPFVPVYFITDPNQTNEC